MSERLTQQQIIDSALIGNLDNEIYNDGVDNYIKLKVNNTEYILKLTNPTPTPTMTPTITPTRTPTPTPTVTPSAAAPSGIPVASTASVTISNYTPHPHIISAGYPAGTFNKSGYTKKANLTPFYGYNNSQITPNGGISYVYESTYDTTFILAPNVSLESRGETFYSGVNKWRIAGHVADDGMYIGLGFYAPGMAYPTDQYILQNDSTDITQIPTSGWYVFDRVTNTNLGASFITITAS